MIYENDKSTVFSITPSILDEFKPGIYPGHFTMAACYDDKKPERLCVTSSDHLMEIPGKKIPVRITTPSYVVAKAIVDDFLGGQLFTTPDAHPGICWIQGEISMDDFLHKYAAVHEQLIATQKRWFLMIITKTNDEWKKFHNSRVVTDVARHAAKYLRIPTPEWMETQEISMNYNKCPACSTMNDPDNCICISCKCVLNAARLAELTFAK